MTIYCKILIINSVSINDNDMKHHHQQCLKHSNKNFYTYHCGNVIKIPEPRKDEVIAKDRTA